MADKKDINDLTDDEVKALTDEQLEEYGVTREDIETDEEREAREMGEEGSPERKSLYKRFKGVNDELKATRLQLEAATRERLEAAERLNEKLAGGGSRSESEVTDEPEPARPKGDIKSLREKRRVAMRAAETDKVADYDEQIEKLEDDLDAWRTERDAWQARKTSKTIETLVKKAGEDALTKAEQKSLKAQMQATAEDIYETYPFLDNDADDDVRDDDAIAAVKNRCIELQNKGMGAVRALKKAAAEKGPKFAKINGYDKSDGDGDGGDDKGDLGPAARLRRAIERGAKDSNAMPPSTSKQGAGERRRTTGQPKAAKDLTDDEIRKLDDNKIDELYGKKVK